LIAYKADAQKLYTKNGEITFYSKAPLENIEALNKSVTAILDAKTGAVQIAILMRGFEFEKALMQEHFNENYVESTKYPKAVFTGSILANEKIDYARDGTYVAEAKGKLMLHGVQKEIMITGRIITTGGIPQLSTEFNLLLSDYTISIPSMVADKVSNDVHIKVVLTLDKSLK
jgi:polyisoprenoid-binding protein YceI